METVDFTGATFDSIKNSNTAGKSAKKKFEMHKKYEGKMLDHFLNETEDVDKWTNPKALLSAIRWMYSILAYMKGNREYRSFLALLGNMTGGHGSSFSKVRKCKIVKRSENIVKKLEEFDLDIETRDLISSDFLNYKDRDLQPIHFASVLPDARIKKQEKQIKTETKMQKVVTKSLKRGRKRLIITDKKEEKSIPRKKYESCLWFK